MAVLLRCLTSSLARPRASNRSARRMRSSQVPKRRTASVKASNAVRNCGESELLKRLRTFATACANSNFACCSCMKTSDVVPILLPPQNVRYPSVLRNEQPDPPPNASPSPDHVERIGRPSDFSHWISCCQALRIALMLTVPTVAAVRGLPFTSLRRRSYRQKIPCGKETQSSYSRMKPTKGQSWKPWRMMLRDSLSQQRARFGLLGLSSFLEPVDYGLIVWN